MAKQLDKSIINGTIDSKKYSEMLENRAIIDRKDIKGSLPIKGKANSIVDLVDGDKVIQRRIYGYNGKTIVDFDTSNHNKPKYHRTGAHKQILDYSLKNPHGPARKITDYELELNKDIIQKGVNYFDV